MAQSFTPAVKAVLKENRCHYARHAKGDHGLWESPHNGRRFVVDNNIKSRFLADAIMKQAGLSYRFR